MGVVLWKQDRFLERQKAAEQRLDVMLMLGMCPNERTLNLEHIGLPTDLIVTDTGCETSNWASMQDRRTLAPDEDDLP